MSNKLFSFCVSIVGLNFLISSKSFSFPLIKSPIARHVFANASVVFLGEPTHGEGNVISEKLKLVKYLHDSLGYSVIAFESGFYDLYEAQQKISSTSSPSELKTLLQQGLFPIWTESEQFQPFYDYLFQHKKELVIAGFDHQLTGSNSVDHLGDSLITFLQSHFPMDAVRVDKDLLEDVIDAFGNEFGFPQEIGYGEFEREMKKVQAILKKISRKSKISTNEKEKAFVLNQTVANLFALGKDYWDKRGRVLDEQTFKARDSNPRDSMMAKNLLALMQLYPNRKIICWGAGTHFMNSTEHLANEELRAYRSMGSYLKKALGEQAVLNLTFISSKGEYGLPGESIKKVPTPTEGSIEADLAKEGRDTLLLLKESPYANVQAISCCLEYQPVKADWSKLFDAFVYLRSFEPNTFLAHGEEDTTPKSEIEAIREVTEMNVSTPTLVWSGIVLDAITREPVAFATIVDTGKRSIVQTNADGYFKLADNGESLLYIINQIGYKKTVYKHNHITKLDTILLRQQDQQLETVTVHGNKVKGQDIFKKVLEHLPENYGNHTFRQTAYTNMRWTNFDTVLLDRDAILDDYVNMNIRKRPWFNIREKRLNKVSLPLAQEVGSVVAGSLVGREDFVRKKNMFKGKRYRGLSFDSVRSYLDSTHGIVYKLYFHANKKSFRYTNDFFTKSFSGVLFVRKENFAIIKTESRLERETGQLQRWSQKNFNRKHEPFWSVYPFRNLYVEQVNYSRCEADKKYYISTAFSHSVEEGKLLTNDQPVNLGADYSYYNIDTIETIADPSKLPFERFKTFQEIKYRSEFWNSFVLPHKNVWFDKGE